MTEPCRHEPTLTITAGTQFVQSAICPCAKCGELATFPVSPPPDTEIRLRLVK